MVTVNFQEGQVVTTLGPFESVTIEEDKLMGAYPSGPTLQIAQLITVHRLEPSPDAGTPSLERMKPMWHVEGQPFTKFVVEQTA